MFILIDPILLVIKDEYWKKFLRKYEKIMVNFLVFFRLIEDFEKRLELRYKLFKIPNFDVILKIIYQYNPFKNYPPHYNNIFKRYIISELYRRKIHTSDLGYHGNIDQALISNAYVPDECISCINNQISYVIRMNNNYSFLSTKSDLASIVNLSELIITFIDEENDRLFELLKSLNIDDILLELKDDPEFGLKVASSINAIQQGQISDPDDIKGFSFIIFKEQFIKYLIKRANFYDQAPEYRARVIQTISCILYDRNNKSINIHKAGGNNEGVYIAYVFKSGKNSPDGKCSRINFRFCGNNTIEFVYYDPNRH